MNPPNHRSTETENVVTRQSPIHGAEDAVVEPGAVLGYASPRGRQAPLVIGDGAHIRTNSIVYAASKIGDRFVTGHNVVIREECEIGDDVSIWSNSVVDYGCLVAADVKIHSNCYIAQFTVIEQGAFIAPGVSIANDLYPGDDTSAKFMSGPHIGAGAQIGVGATILPYVKIGANAMVGSGAVVTKDIPDATVAVGNPAVCTKHISELRPIEERVVRASHE